MLTSPDLVHWSDAGGALAPVPAHLGTDYWAPEVAFCDDRYYLYYSLGHGDSGHHLRVAVADDPTGPFIDTGVNLTPGERFAIDAHPYRDVDGSWYLFYAHDVLAGPRVGTMLAVDRLTTMTTLAGEATTIVRRGTPTGRSTNAGGSCMDAPSTGTPSKAPPCSDTALGTTASSQAAPGRTRATA